MNDFVARTSRWRTGVFVAGSIGFVAIGIWMAGLLGPVPVSTRAGPLMTEYVGWFSIFFFGVSAVASAKLWCENKERLRISGLGIRWFDSSDQTIPWNEISNVTEWRQQRQKFIVLHLSDPAKFPGRRGFAFAMRATKALTGGDIAISLTGTDQSFEDAMKAIREFRQSC